MAETSTLERNDPVRPVDEVKVDSDATVLLLASLAIRCACVFVTVVKLFLIALRIVRKSSLIRGC